MQSRAPAFQLYAGDVLADGRFAAMEYDERGVYFTLLCHAWLEEGIPADVKKLARLLRIPPRRFARLWEAVAPCWVPSPADPERLVQPRMERVRADQREYREKKVRAGKRSAEARAARRDKATEVEHRSLPVPNTSGCPLPTEGQPSGLRSSSPPPVSTAAAKQPPSTYTSSCARHAPASAGADGKLGGGAA